MLSKLITIATLCTTIFSIHALAVESTNSSYNSSTAIVSSSSSLLSSQNTLSLTSSSQSISISSLSYTSSVTSSSAILSCEVVSSSQNTIIFDDDKIECNNSDIESDKDDKSKEIITKKEKRRYNQCKKDEEGRRKNAYKKSMTSCKKKPKKITHDLTDEDYNVLFDNLEQIKDEIAKLFKIIISNYCETYKSWIYGYFVWKFKG
jgi:hypothetical protein